MRICETQDHIEIVYESGECPLCKTLVELYDLADALQSLKDGCRLLMLEDDDAKL